MMIKNLLESGLQKCLYLRKRSISLQAHFKTLCLNINWGMARVLKECESLFEMNVPWLINPLSLPSL